MTLTVPCACGGLVTGDYSDEKLTRAAIQRHQLTYRHLIWRENLELSNGHLIVGRVVVTADGTFLEPIGKGDDGTMDGGV